MFGYNDAKSSLGHWKNHQAFYNEYTKFVKKLQDRPFKPQIYIMTPPPVYNIETSKSRIV